ncbi:cysteine synthase A [Clostridium senegalense]|uniref:cysteine synthase A n=1 Tax=Clostridium senegalense TaxID=1465809 RepID=UPI001C10A29E|nr:cysteine synthase A [Clostridium senegalense]MBU5225835.1 cysteine synthase A [Clostridium senegalense]
MLYENILDMIGKTPIIKLNSLTSKDMAEVYVKLEKYNPAGSIKDRAALGMIEAAEKEGLLSPDSIILEPTSGNTGIALAMIGRLKGYKVALVMPETMSLERRKLIKAYGAELILTDGSKGMNGAIEKALELASKNPNYFIPQQFENINNPKKHYESTALEIIEDLPNLSAFVAGVGTSGTITGIGKKLKEYNSSVEIIAVEPLNSAVISGKKPSPHKIQGIGAGFIPKLFDPSIVDSIITVSDEDAFKTANDLAKLEGLFLGISSGANVFAAIQIAKKLGPNHKVLAISPDGGEKYISMNVFS